MKMRALCFMILVIGLSACSTIGTKNVLPPASIDNSKIHYDTNLLQPCEALPSIADPVNLDVLSKAYLVLQGQYADCAIEQHCLAKAIQLSTKKEQIAAADKCFNEEGSPTTKSVSSAKNGPSRTTSP